MATRKPTQSDVDYVEKKLSILKDQMEKAEKYLEENRWDLIEDHAQRSREFQFQKSLSDSLFSWTESYVNLSGILDVYNQLQALNKSKSLRSGQSVSGIQSFVKSNAERKGRK